MVEKNTSGRKKATVAGLAVVGLIAAAGAGAGLHALFTDTKSSEPANFQTGTVGIDLMNNNEGFDFTENLANFAAGDTSYRFFTVKNAGQLDVGRLQARIVVDKNSQLANQGNPDAVNTLRVDNKNSVGKGDTPLHMKITACMDGGKWETSTTEQNVDGTSKLTVTCSTGKTEEVFLKNEFKGKTVTLGDVPGEQKDKEGWLTLSTFNGDIASDTIQGDGVEDGNGKNVTLFDVRETAADDSDGDATNDPGKDEVENVGNGQRTLLAPDEDVAYMVSYHLPSDAKNEYQNTTADMRFFITATQRDGKVFDAEKTD